MATVSVRYVGPFQPVYVPILGITMDRESAVEISEDIAGSPPSFDGTDLGHGLLAQPANWARVEG